MPFFAPQRFAQPSTGNPIWQSNGFEDVVNSLLDRVKFKMVGLSKSGASCQGSFYFSNRETTIKTTMGPIRDFFDPPPSA